MPAGCRIADDGDWATSFRWRHQGRRIACRHSLGCSRPGNTASSTTAPRDPQHAYSVQRDDARSSGWRRNPPAGHACLGVGNGTQWPAGMRGRRTAVPAILAINWPRPGSSRRVPAGRRRWRDLPLMLNAGRQAHLGRRHLTHAWVSRIGDARRLIHHGERAQVAQAFRVRFCVCSPALAVVIAGRSRPAGRQHQWPRRSPAVVLILATTGWVAPQRSAPRWLHRDVAVAVDAGTGGSACR